MKRKFTIPVMCALLLHAALLLGFRSEPGPVDAGEDDDISILVTPVFETRSDPPTVELDGEKDEPVARRGDRMDSEPKQPELPPVDDLRSFPMAPVPITATSSMVLTKIPAGVIGLPDGDPDGNILTSGVFDVTKLDASPRAVAQVSPLYPAEARLHGHGGEVVVGFTVDESGRVTTPHVIRTTDPVFNKAALQAVGKWRFEPGRHHGRVVRFKMAVPIVFRINA